MPYCTQTDILEQLPEDDLIALTDDSDAGVVDTSVVDRAIADADAMIDAYCQGKYTVPLSPVPAMIRRISVELSIFNVYSRRADELPEVRKDRHKEDVRFLEKVSEGKITLGVSSPAPVTTGNDVQVSSSTRVFSRDSLKDY